MKMGYLGDFREGFVDLALVKNYMAITSPIFTVVIDHKP